MGCMTTHAHHEQLELLPADGVPVRLRLDERTRRIGLAGVARARAILDEQARQRAEARSAEAGAPPQPLGAHAHRRPRAA